MKIINRTEFLKMPEGTIFSKGVKWGFDGLAIKHESLSNDWWELSPCWVESDDSAEAFNRLEEMLARGASYPMDEDVGRDGLYQDDDIFLIFEKDDLLRLREYIDEAIMVA